uniref:Uncharacterized protein n=1 Tax=Geospiza parvula TaxID=87175 RepID=A0A8C3MBY5_GEOPR
GERELPRRLRRLHHAPHDHPLQWQRVRRAHQPLQDLVHGSGRIGRAAAAAGQTRPRRGPPPPPPPPPRPSRRPAAQCRRSPRGPRGSGPPLAQVAATATASAPLPGDPDGRDGTPDLTRKRRPREREAGLKGAGGAWRRRRLFRSTLRPPMANGERARGGGGAGREGTEGLLQRESLGRAAWGEGLGCRERL